MPRIPPLWQGLWKAQSGCRERAILLSGSLLQPGQTWRWLEALRNQPLLAALAAEHPAWPLKVYRPYLSNRLGCHDRIDVLCQHYGLLSSAGLAGWALELARRPMTVAQFSGKNGAGYQLELSAVGMGSREGELYLRLVVGTVFLYRAAFSFIVVGDRQCVEVGGVQGVRAEDGAESVRATTRDLYGCRPKNLIIAVIRDIGAYFGCIEMIGVGNRNRIVARSEKATGRSPDYDTTWEEIGARSSADGNFTLSCLDILRTSYEDVPSKKRSEMKKRNALLASIFADVRVSLDRQRSTCAQRA